MVRRPIRVLWITKGLARGGAEQLLLSTAEALDPVRIRPEVAYLLPTHDTLVSSFSELGVPTHCLDCRSEADPRWLLRLHALLASEHFDVVHSHSPYPAGLARLLTRAFRGARRPALVYTEHNTWAGYDIRTRLLNQITYGMDDVQLAVSRQVISSMPPHRRTRVEQLDHGVALSGLRSASKATLRAELGITDDECLVLTVANMRPQKNYPRLLTATRRLLDDGHPIRLVAVGDGPLLSSITDLRDRLGLRGHVHLLGARRDVPSLLRVSDIFVLSSDWEGMPVAVMEAMAVGLPVVATGVGGLPDAVRSGTDGLLVDPAHESDLASALALLIHDGDLRRSMGRSAAERAQRFDIRRTTARLTDIYAGLVTNSELGS